MTAAVVTYSLQQTIKYSETYQLIVVLFLPQLLADELLVQNDDFGCFSHSIVSC